MTAPADRPRNFRSAWNARTPDSVAAATDIVSLLQPRRGLFIPDITGDKGVKSA